MEKSPLLIHAADRWVNCPGSVLLSETYPNVYAESDSESRLEGRAMHEVAQKILESFNGGDSLVGRSELVNTTSRDGVLITDEFYDAAREYANDVLKFCNGTGTLRALHVEDRVDLSMILDGVYGYCDAWVFDVKTMKLVVWDAKFGHKYTPAFENWQLVCYAFGILEKLKVNGHTDQHIDVELRVSQPRCFTGDGSVQVWEVKASDLRAYFNTVKNSATESCDFSAKCRTGRWCDNCPANQSCDTLRNSTFNLYDTLGAMSGTPVDAESLSLMLRIVEQVKEHVDTLHGALNEQAIATLQSGELVPGWSTEIKKGRTRWRKDTPIDEVIMMADLMGINARKPEQLDTPKQLLNKGIDEDVISQYTETPNTGVKLVRLSTEKLRNIFKR